MVARADIGFSACSKFTDAPAVEYVLALAVWSRDRTHDGALEVPPGICALYCGRIVGRVDMGCTHWRFKRQYGGCIGCYLWSIWRVFCAYSHERSQCHTHSDIDSYQHGVRVHHAGNFLASAPRWIGNRRHLDANTATTRWQLPDAAATVKISH